MGRKHYKSFGSRCRYNDVAYICRMAKDIGHANSQRINRSWYEQLHRGVNGWMGTRLHQALAETLSIHITIYNYWKRNRNKSHSILQQF